MRIKWDEFTILHKHKFYSMHLCKFNSSWSRSESVKLSFQSCMKGGIHKLQLKAIPNQMSNFAKLHKKFFCLHIHVPKPNKDVQLYTITLIIAPDVFPLT